MPESQIDQLRNEVKALFFKSGWTQVKLSKKADVSLEKARSIVDPLRRDKAKESDLLKMKSVLKGVLT